MARIPRKFILEDNSYFHVTWKCHNHDFLLRDEKTKRKLASLLAKHKFEYSIKIFAYCFMDNHPHIVGFCQSVELFSAFFRRVNSQLAQYINRVYERRGQVVMDRIRSPRIESAEHLANAIHYVDLNPVRAGICKRAIDYKWSSFRARTQNFKDPLLDPLPAEISLDAKVYADRTYLFLIEYGNPIALFEKTFFIGSPQWIRRMRFELYEKLLQLRSKHDTQKKEAHSK